MSYFLHEDLNLNENTSSDSPSVTFFPPAISKGFCPEAVFGLQKQF